MRHRYALKSHSDSAQPRSIQEGPMPWTAHYFADGAYVTFTGHTTGRDILDANAAFYARPYIHGPRFAVFDFSAVDRLDVDGAALERAIEQDLDAAGRDVGDMAAVIVAPDEGAYLLARAWELRVEATGWRTKVARSRSHALRWLRDQRLAMARSRARVGRGSLTMPRTADYVADGAYVAFSGHTTGRDIIAAVRELVAHRYDDGPRFALVDFTGVENFDVDAVDIDRIVYEHRRAAATAPGLAAVVVAPESVGYRLSRIWELRLEPTTWRTKIVTSVSDAIRWLSEQGIDTGGLAVSNG
jgi:hypothetical protein